MSRTSKGHKPPGWEYWGKRPMQKNSTASGKSNKRIGIQRERATLKRMLKKEVKNES